jgi:DNA-binding NtrC family response regulator
MANILLLDDKPGVRRILAEELAFQNYTVFSTGEISLVHEVIRYSNLDLVIMDPFVKGQHRWDLLLEIKQWDPYLPVILVTEFPNYRRDPRSALSAGLLVKSFDLEDLLRKIAEVLPRKQACTFGEDPDRRAAPEAAPFLPQTAANIAPPLFSAAHAGRTH